MPKERDAISFASLILTHFVNAENASLVFISLWGLKKFALTTKTDSFVLVRAPVSV